MYRTEKYSQHSSIIWPVWLNGWVFVYELSGCGLESSCRHLNFRFRACLSKEVLDIQATIECGFTLKRVRDMIRTYSQMHRADKYSQHRSIIWLVWLNGWVVIYELLASFERGVPWHSGNYSVCIHSETLFVYELSGCGFESSCSHLNFRFCACFEEGVPWHSGNYRVWIHSETRTWHDKNIQSNAPYR